MTMPAVVILTRFNLHMKFGGADSPNLDREWLERRVQLFEKWCQPSVANQTFKQFRWLVMLDPGTPQDVLDRLNSLASVDAQRIDDPEHRSLGKRVTEGLDEDWIITANLDSDDMLHKDFVKDLVESFANEPPTARTFLLFPSGFSVSGQKYYRMDYLSNQFRAVAEPVKTCETIFAVDHDKVAGLDNKRCVHRQPRWAMLVHGTNVANQLRGYRDLSVDPVDFGQPPNSVGFGDSLDVPVSWCREMIRRTGIVGRIRAILRRSA